MFTRILTPVDLAHKDRLGRALQCAADLARLHGVPVVYVGVSASVPTAVAHNPAEYKTRLSEFAAAQGAAHGIETEAHARISHDPATDLEATLLKAIDETGADLVVMASHVPGLADRIWASNGSRIAEHAKVSVMIVRDAPA
ncbi:universal stress protein [Oceaniglobus indicus]|uniref:universal stress protein n=1 Tax=Oceaniglobus indicus TaxID=2047749 RepID=UPI000C17A9F9|nr:universal stress protein [Oceaniglobus indicus]